MKAKGSVSTMSAPSWRDVLVGSPKVSSKVFLSQDEEGIVAEKSCFYNFLPWAPMEFLFLEISLF